MSWTYSGDPAFSAKDEVRFLVGDTDTTKQLMSDEEINYVLVIHADPGSTYANYTAAAVVAETIAASMAKQADRTVGSLSIQYAQKHDHYVALAERLREFAISGVLGRGSKVGVPVLGGGGQTYLGGGYA